MNTTCSQNQNGFSLIEILMVLGVSAIVVAGTAAALLVSHRDHQNFKADANLIMTSKLINDAMNPRRAAASAAVSCSQKLALGEFGLDTSINTSVNLASGTKTHVQLAHEGSVFKQGAQIPGLANFRVAELYLADHVALAPNLYLANFFLSGDNGSLTKRPRQIGSLTIEVDPITSQITKCNTASGDVDPQNACSSTYGFRWNATDGVCEQALVDDNGVYTFDKCPPGLIGLPPNCRAMPSTCASGQVATGYRLGLVANCAKPTINGVPTNMIGTPLSPEPLALGEGAPPPAPPAPPAAVSYDPPSVGAPIAASGPTVAPAACNQPNTVSEITQSACNGDPFYNLDSGYNVYYSGSYCDWGALTVTPVADDDCVERIPANYSTPDLTVATLQPDPPAPADNSCQCNAYRISHGEYCMYCMEDVDFGFGYVDYAYGVSQCNNGNLQEVSSPVMSAPISNCYNGYSRATQTGPNTFRPNGSEPPDLR